jgi:hypothetical protein
MRQVLHSTDPVCVHPRLALNMSFGQPRTPRKKSRPNSSFASKGGTEEVEVLEDQPRKKAKSASRPKRTSIRKVEDTQAAAEPNITYRPRVVALYKKNLSVKALEDSFALAMKRGTKAKEPKGAAGKRTRRLPMRKATGRVRKAASRR